MLRNRVTKTVGLLAIPTLAVLFAASLSSNTAYAKVEVRSALTTPKSDALKDRIVVKFKESASPSAQENAVNTVDGDVVLSLNAKTVAVKVGKDKADDAVAVLSQDPNVEKVTHDHARHLLDVTPNDPCYKSCTLVSPTETRKFNQNNFASIGSEKAWDVTTGSSAVRVAVIDSGVSRSHPDLAGKVDYGPNFVSSATNDDDEVGHGSHVAGIIAANTNNNDGVAGLGWNTRILSLKVATGDGEVGTASEVSAAIRYAADQGARVINLSLGGDESDPEEAAAIAYAQSKNVLIVAAAGNSGEEGNPIFYPAAYPGVLSVGATNNNGATASFSEHGTWVKVGAPGVGILSTFMGDQFASLDGTSMASPHVVAEAALILATNPSMSATDLYNRITSTTDTVPGSGKDFQFGRINVAKAVGATTTPSSTTTTVGQNTTTTVRQGNNTTTTINQNTTTTIAPIGPGHVTAKLIETTNSQPIHESGIGFDLYRKIVGGTVTPAPANNDAQQIDGYVQVMRGETNANGIADFGIQQPGTYALRQLSTPKDHVEKTTLAPDHELVAGENIEIPFTNRLFPTLTGKNFDAETHKPIAGSTYDLYKKLDAGQTATPAPSQPKDVKAFDGYAWVKRVSSDNNGVTNFGLLDPQFAYCAFEHSAPTGYLANKTLSCSAGRLETTPVKFSHEVVTNDTNEPVPNTTFDIFRELKPGESAQNPADKPSTVDVPQGYVWVTSAMSSSEGVITADNLAGGSVYCWTERDNVAHANGCLLDPLMVSELTLTVSNAKMPVVLGETVNATNASASDSSLAMTGSNTIPLAGLGLALLGLGYGFVRFARHRSL